MPFNYISWPSRFCNTNFSLYQNPSERSFEKYNPRTCIFGINYDKSPFSQCMLYVTFIQHLRAKLTVLVKVNFRSLDKTFPESVSCKYWRHILWCSTCVLRQFIPFVSYINTVFHWVLIGSKALKIEALQGLKEFKLNIPVTYIQNTVQQPILGVNSFFMNNWPWKSNCYYYYCYYLHLYIFFVSM